MKLMVVGKQGAFLLFIFIISGCATFQFAPSPPSMYKANYTLEDYNSDLSFYKPLGTAVDVRTYYRNKIVFLTKTEIDKNYAAFKNSFYGERAGTETLLDIAQIGLTSAGTLAAGETIKTVLAAVATGVSGSRLSFNKNFFKEKSPDILISRMDALRVEKWSQIHLQLINSTDDKYSLYEAEGDLFAYYQAGSLQAAFQNIIAESGAIQKEADNKIWEQIKQKYGERIGEPASEDQVKDIKQLFKDFQLLTDSVREDRAKKVIDKFKELQPTTAINPAAANPSSLDNVKYLYILALSKDFPEVRKALTQAFQDAARSK
ncbi:MAG: hypothetical protein ACLP2P_00595 [Desulfobaccales bacterium]